MGSFGLCSVSGFQHGKYRNIGEGRLVYLCFVLASAPCSIHCARHLCSIVRKRKRTNACVHICAQHYFSCYFTAILLDGIVRALTPCRTACRPREIDLGLSIRAPLPSDSIGCTKTIVRVGYYQIRYHVFFSISSSAEAALTHSATPSHNDLTMNVALTGGRGAV